MKYHFRRGTDRIKRRRRVHFAAASLLVVIGLCGTMLQYHRNQAKSLESRAAHKTSSAQAVASASAAGLRTSDCGGGGPKRQGLVNSSVSQLRKLAEYEFVCGGEVTKRVSFFVPLPVTADEAVGMGRQTAAALKEFAKYNVSPLVFLEPRKINGDLADMPTYRAGGYDAALDAYFAAIRDAGISDTQMGMWNPIPEGNTPVWGDTSPETFTTVTKRTVELQKKHFPGSKASILLESKTYPSGSSWEGGKYVSLLPYVNNLPQGLIDSFGLQGFPSGAMSPLDRAVLEPATYLRTDLAIEAAASLGVKDIWFNTGTFATFHKGDNMPLFSLNEKQRQQILDSVLTQTRAIRAAGYQSAVHLFARDKSATSERVDWSYWKAGQMNASPATPVFKTFVSDTRAAGVPLWLYDNDTR